jgi:hypothetical protein
MNELITVNKESIERYISMAESEDDSVKELLLTILENNFHIKYAALYVLLLSKIKKKFLVKDYPLISKLLVHKLQDFVCNPVKDIETIGYFSPARFNPRKLAGDVFLKYRFSFWLQDVISVIFSNVEDIQEINSPEAKVVIAFLIKDIIEKDIQKKVNIELKIENVKVLN